MRVTFQIYAIYWRLFFLNSLFTNDAITFLIIETVRILKLKIKNKISLTLFVKYNCILDVRKTLKLSSYTDKTYPYKVLKYPKSN